MNSPYRGQTHNLNIISAMLQLSSSQGLKDRANLTLFLSKEEK